MIRAIIKSGLLISLIQATVIPTRTSRTDPCVAVCEEFSAARRGNGWDLCDPAVLSQCVYLSAASQYFCTNIFWAYTEDGQRGLTYSVDGSDLTDIEAASQFTCLEAVHLLGPRDVSTVSPYETHYWTPTVPPTSSTPFPYDDIEALRQLAIAAGYPADWDQRTSTTSPSSCGTRITSTTTTTTPFYMNTDPEQMRIRAIAGGWPERYFSMYGTTPTPPSRES